MPFLFKKIDISSLVLFRIVFGILALIDIASTFFYKHLFKNAFDSTGFQFHYYGFEWVVPFPEPLMSIFFIILMMAAINITLGYRYKMSALIFALGFTYTFFLEKAFYLNHGYLVCWISFLIIFFPANRNYALDVKRGAVSSLNKISYWPIFILQFMMGVVYFFGGIAKINQDWLAAYPLKLWLKTKQNMFLLGPIWEKDITAYIMSYGGLALDLFVVFFLLGKRTRNIALLFILFFHITNIILFQIGIFPFLSVLLTLLYWPADGPKKFRKNLTEKLRFLQPILAKVDSLFIPPNLENQIQKEESPFLKNTITVLIGVLCLIHVLLPLRHHLFDSEVAWSEEGHRYSWRMMLRSKNGYGTFKVISDISEKPLKIKPADFLSKRQNRKMYTHPDMILEFAHYLEDLEIEKGAKEVQVFADIKTKLNGRKHQTFIDPTVDLTKIKWSFLTESQWIVPFENTPKR